MRRWTDCTLNHDAKLVLVSGAACLGDLGVKDGVFVWMVFVEWWGPVRLVYTVGGEEGIEDGHGYFEAELAICIVCGE
jgi:hypothetical protein